MADFAKNDDPSSLLAFDPAAVAIRAARNEGTLEKLASFVKELQHYINLNRQTLEGHGVKRAKMDPGGEYKELDQVSAGTKQYDSPTTKDSVYPHPVPSGFGGYGYGCYPSSMIAPMFMNPVLAGGEYCMACGQRFPKSPAEDGFLSSMPPLGEALQIKAPFFDPGTNDEESSPGRQQPRGAIVPPDADSVGDTVRARKGSWTEREDAIVMEAVSRSEVQPFTAWTDLAHRLPGRSGKSIRDRWVNHLNPILNLSPFSKEDDLTLWNGFKEFGKRWVDISTKIFNSTRSENTVKNRFYSATFKKFIGKEFGPNAYPELDV